MKKLIIILFLLFNTCLLIAQVSVTRDALLQRDESKVLVVSHRGEWRQAPENSLKAMELAIQAGADIVEIDLAKTKDGQIILMHDKTIDRTTTGKGKVSDWTLDSLKTLKLKNGAGIRTKHSIPTLEEVLLLAKGKVMINLDKSYDIFDEIYPILNKTNTVDHIIMKGNKDVKTVKKDLAAYLDKIIYMPVVSLNQENATEIVKDFYNELDPVAFEFTFSDSSNPLPRQMASSLQGKSLIWYNTLWDTLAGGYDDDLAVEDPEAAYGFLIENLNARIIQTDRAPYLVNYLRQKGRKQ